MFGDDGVRHAVETGLEGHDLHIVGAFHGGEEVAHLLHLHPHAGAQHDHVVHARSHHPGVGGGHRFAALLVKIHVDPCQVACRVIDLQVLPMDERGHVVLLEQCVAVLETAVHHTTAEVEQPRFLKGALPCAEDLLGNLLVVGEALDPCAQLTFDLVGGERGELRLAEELRAQAVYGGDGSAERTTLGFGEVAQWRRFTVVVLRHHDGERLRAVLFVECFEIPYVVKVETQADRLLCLAHADGGDCTPRQQAHGIGALRNRGVVFLACSIQHDHRLQAVAVAGLQELLGIAHAGR